MKTTLFATVIFVSMALFGNAQIGIGGIKGKVKEKTKEVVPEKVIEKTEDKIPVIKSPSAPVEETKEEKWRREDSIERAKIKASPASKEINTYRIQISGYMQDAKKADCSGYDKIEAMFFAIKEKDPNWEELAEDEAKFKSIEVICEPVRKEMKEISVYEKYFDRASGKASSMMQENDFYTFQRLDSNNNLVRTNFEKMKAEYLLREKKYDGINGQINYIENVFYVQYGAKVMSFLKFTSDNEYKNSIRFTSATRSKPGYVFSPYYGLESEINKLKKKLSYINNAVNMIPGDTALLAYQKEVQARVSELDEYVNSGKYDADMDAYNEAKLDKVRCPKSMNTNPELIALVKKSFRPAAHGTLYRVSLSDKDWTIERNKYGTITGRRMTAYLVYGDGKKCTIGLGIINCGYDGKKYTAPWFDYGDYEPISCKNVMK